MIRRFIVLGLAVTAPASTHAQLAPNGHYDGRVTLARLKYDPLGEPEGCLIRDSPAGEGWGHDYPMSVQGLMKAATELTNTRAVVDSNMVFTATDPELMKHPIVMLTEPGCWDPTDEEAKALRQYLLRGGLLIVDDLTFGFCTPDDAELSIQRFETWIRRVLPEARPMRLEPTHPIFDGFFRVDPRGVQAFCSDPVQVTGIYEDNDPAKRLLVVSSYYGALGDLWAYVDSDIGSGLEEGGSAYKLGLNYLIYGLSH